jgi:hypothetical protein
MKNVDNVLCIALFFTFHSTLSYSQVERITRGEDPYRKKNNTCVTEICIPFLETKPVIDGDLQEWKDYAFHDGIWDIFRIQYTEWYNPARNRLTDHGNELSAEYDLQSRYYIAWDNNYLYMGAEVQDNVNDVSEQKHQSHRWYYKDCIALFWEAPRDTFPELFQQGDNAFCFVIDTAYPDYGAWWRHGNVEKSYIEQPIPKDACSYRIRMNPWNRNGADFILEARINLSMTFALSDPAWKDPKINDIYSLEIVHTDPDGGNYGGHLIIYGDGDDDKTWGKVILTGPQKPIVRKSN